MRPKRKNLNLLLVEDSAIMRDRLITLAEEVSGVELIDVAVDGAGAILKFEQHQPDAILLDIGLPDMSGLQVLRHIRRRSASAVVMIYTGSACVEMDECCWALGADYCLDKSEDIGQLIAALHEAVHARNTPSTVIADFPLPASSI